jgi:hypothetical protein
MRVLASLWIVTSLATVAAADPPGLTPQADPEDTTVEVPSYRLQTAAADAAVLTLGVISAKSGAGGGGVGAVVALGGYLLAAPLVHVAHDHSDRAGESIALRVGLPLLGGVVGNLIGRSQCSYQCDNDADIALTAFGVMVGAGAASVLDIAYLSRGETVRRSAPRLAPTAGVGPNGQIRVGLGGTF